MNNREDNKLLEQHLKNRTEKKILELNNSRFQRIRNDVFSNSFEVHKLLSDPKKLIDFLASNTTDYDLKIKLGIIFNIDSLFVLNTILSEGIISSTGSNISEERLKLIVAMIQNQNPTLDLDAFRNAHGKNIFEITNLTWKEAQDLALSRAKEIQDDELEQSIQAITQYSGSRDLRGLRTTNELIASCILHPSNIEYAGNILRAKYIFDLHSPHNKENPSYEVVHQAIDIVFAQTPMSHCALHRASILHSLNLQTARMVNISNGNEFIHVLSNLSVMPQGDNALHALACVVPQNSVELTIYKLVVHKLIDDYQLDINAEASKDWSPYEVPTHFDRTPVNLSIVKHNHAMLFILLSKGADISGGICNCTPVHLAAKMNDTKAIKMLCEAGANVLIKMYSKDTPLQMLLNSNANPDQEAKAILEECEVIVYRQRFLNNFKGAINHSALIVFSVVSSAMLFNATSRFLGDFAPGISILFGIPSVGIMLNSELAALNALSNCPHLGPLFFHVPDFTSHTLRIAGNIGRNAIHCIQNANELVEQSIVERGMCNIL